MNVSTFCNVVTRGPPKSGRGGVYGGPPIPSEWNYERICASPQKIFYISSVRENGEFWCFSTHSFL